MTYDLEIPYGCFGGQARITATITAGTLTNLDNVSAVAWKWKPASGGTLVSLTGAVLVSADKTVYLDFADADWDDNGGSLSSGHYQVEILLTGSGFEFPVPSQVLDVYIRPRLASS